MGKFYIHLFRELREKYEIEAESMDEAKKMIDRPSWWENKPDPIEIEHQDYLSHILIDPVLPDGTVDYENSEWIE